jgi:hypothetical protein
MIIIVKLTEENKDFLKQIVFFNEILHDKIKPNERYADCDYSISALSTNFIDKSLFDNNYTYVAKQMREPDSYLFIIHRYDILDDAEITDKNNFQFIRLFVLRKASIIRNRNGHLSKEYFIQMPFPVDDYNDLESFNKVMMALLNIDTPEAQERIKKSGIVNEVKD